MDLVTIDGLIAAAAEAVRDLSQGNARVQAQPDLRMVRYYASHGLIDPPTAWQGRTALYGQRHLLQLTAIKRLQAGGLSLVRIQQLLVGADEARLHQLGAAGAADAATGASAGLGRARRPLPAETIAPPTFTSEPVAPLAPAPTPPTMQPTPALAVQPAQPRRAATAFWKPAAPALLLQQVLRIALPGGAVLELPAGASDPQLLNALEAALAPLRRLLESRQPGGLSAPTTPAAPDSPVPFPHPTAPTPRSQP